MSPTCIHWAPRGLNTTAHQYLPDVLADMLSDGGLLFWPACWFCCSAIAPRKGHTAKFPHSLKREPIFSAFLHSNTNNNTNSKQGGRSFLSTSVVNSQSHAAGGRTSSAPWLAVASCQAASHWPVSLVLSWARFFLQRYKTCILTRPAHWLWRHLLLELYFRC